MSKDDECANDQHEYKRLENRHPSRPIVVGRSKESAKRRAYPQVDRYQSPERKEVGWSGSCEDWAGLKRVGCKGNQKRKSNGIQSSCKPR